MNAVATIGRALVPAAVTAIVVQPGATAADLSAELRTAALQTLSLHGPSVDDWWAHASSAQRLVLVLRLQRVLLELDGLSVRALGEDRWRAALGLPLALATYALTWKLRRRSRAANTLRAWRDDWRTWRRWCKREGTVSFNPSAAQLQRFFTDYAPSHKLATIRRFGASLSAHHRAAGFPDPLTHPIAQEIWRAALKPPPKKIVQRNIDPTKSDVDRRTLPVDQAEGLTRPQLELLLRRLDQFPDRLLEVRDAALLALTYDLLGRIAEIAALQREDIRFEADGSGTARIRRSKTDQHGTGKSLYVRPDTCARVRAWLQLSGVRSGAVFRALRGRHSTIAASEAPALNPVDIRRVLQRRVREAGLADAADYSGHSMRVGAAQDMAANGVADIDIMNAGRWSSLTMVARYTERQRAKVGGMAKLAKAQDVGASSSRQATTVGERPSQHPSTPGNTDGKA